MAEFDPASLGAVAVEEEFDPASLGAVPVEEEFDPSSLGAIAVEKPDTLSDDWTGFIANTQIAGNRMLQGITASRLNAVAKTQKSAQLARQAADLGTPEAFDAYAADQQEVFGPAGFPSRDPEKIKKTADILERRWRDESLKIPEFANYLAQKEKRIQELTPSLSPEMQKFNEAKGAEFWKTFAANPVESLANVIASSAIVSAPAIAAGAVGSLAGPAGTAAATAAGSYSVETSQAILDALKSADVDIANPEQVEAAFTDPAVMEKARDFANKRGVPIAIFDAATAGIAGRFIGPALKEVITPTTKAVLTATGKEVLTQAVGGAAGEFTAQVAAGQEISVKDIALEALGEIGTGVTEVTGNIRARNKIDAELAKIGTSEPPPMSTPSEPIKTPATTRETQPTAQYAESLRTNEGQIPPTGDVDVGIQGTSGQDLQLETPQEPSGTELPQPPVQEEKVSPHSPQTTGESIVSTGILGEDGKPLVGQQWNSPHAEIIKQNPELALIDDIENRKGFIIQDANGTQRFVGRKQALEVGQKAGQVDIAKVYDPEGHGMISEALIQIGPSPKSTGVINAEQAAQALQPFLNQAVDAARQAGAIDPESAASQAQIELSKQVSEGTTKLDNPQAIFLEAARRQANKQQEKEGAQKRGGKVTEPIEAAPEPSVTRGPRADIVSEEDIQSIDAKIDTLPEQQKRVMRALTEDPDLTDLELAEQTGMTEGAVKQAKARARQTLRDFISKQGIGANLGPGAANIEEVLTQYEQRKFGKRFQETEEIATEIKKETGDRYYEIIPNQVTAERATELIETHGTEQIEDNIRDEKSDLSFADRVTVGQILIKRYNEQFKAEKNPEQARKILDRASSLAEWAADFGTKLGQGVQAFAMWMRLTAQGKLRTFEKLVKAKRDNFTRDNRSDIDEIKETTNRATKESASKTSKAQKVKAAVSKTLSDNKYRSGGRPIWTQYEVSAIKNLENALFAGGSKSRLPALQEFTGRLIANLRDKLPQRPKAKGESQERSMIREAINNFEKYKQVWDDTANSLKLKYGDQPSILEKLDKIFGPAFKEPFSRKTIQSLIREKIQQDEIKLSELITKHYSHAEKTGKDLADKIASELNLSPEGAALVSKAVESEFQVIATKAKASALTSLASRNPTLKKVGKKGFQKIIEASNKGALTDELFYNAVSEQLGLPSYSPEIAAEIQRLAALVDSAPEGMPKMEAMRELNTYIAKQKGYDPTDLLFGIYYGNILSGTGTHLVNLVDTVVNVVNETGVLALQNPRAAVRIMSALGRGAARGTFDSVMAFMKGRRLTDGKFAENPFFMETAEFGKKGGVPLKTSTRFGRAAKAVTELPIASPLRAWKYVGRIMSATDALAFRAAQEAKSAQLAWQIANDPQSTQTIDQILGYDRMAEFQKQAESEGYTGYQKQARATELMLMSRPEELQKAATDFASEGTYNVKPYGVIGTISNSIESASRKVPPLKLIVPFTRIVGNVLNRGINNSPWGYVRALRGKAGLETDPLTLKKYSSEERNALMVRAHISMAMITTLAALHATGVITVHGGGPSDPEKKRQLRQTGWKPYTVQVGDGYYSTTYTPWGIVLAAMGNYFDSQKYQDLSAKSALDKATYVLLSVAGSLFNQSFLTGLSNFFDILSEKTPGEQASAARRFAAQTTSSAFVPLSSLAKDVESWVSEPNIPKASTLSEALISNIPFASQGLRPQLNALGEPMKSNRSRFISDRTDDPVWRMISDKGLRIPVPNVFFDDPDSQYEYVQEQGKLLRKWIEANMGRLKNAESKQAQVMIENASDSFRERSRNKLILKGAKKKQKPLASTR